MSGGNFTGVAKKMAPILEANSQGRDDRRNALRAKMVERWNRKNTLAALANGAKVGAEADGHLELSAMFRGLEVEEAAAAAPAEQPKEEEKPKKKKRNGKKKKPTGNGV